MCNFFFEKNVFLRKKLAYMQKKQYFCSRFQAAMVESVDTKDFENNKSATKETL